MLIMPTTYHNVPVYVICIAIAHTLTIIRTIWVVIHANMTGKIITIATMIITVLVIRNVTVLYIVILNV